MKQRLVGFKGMRQGTIHASEAADFRYQMPELPRCYSGETEPMQRLLALACLQLEKARPETGEEEQKEAEWRSAVIATQQHTAEAGLNFEQCLEYIVDQARRIMGADGAAIALSDGEGFICRGSSGALAPDLGAHVNPQSGISGECLRTGEIQQCDDTETDSRVEPSICRSQGMRSVLAVPVKHHEALGILAVFSGWAGVFSERDVRTLCLLADLVAARLPQDEPRVARIAEMPPAQSGLDIIESPRAAEPATRPGGELLPVAVEMRELPSRRGSISLKTAVLALAVLVVASEAVVWRGWHVDRILAMAKVFFATRPPGVTPHPNAPAIAKPAATIPRQQAASKTLFGKTVGPASTPSPTQAGPPQNATGEKRPPTSATAPLRQSSQASAMASPRSAPLEAPLNLPSHFSGLETILQPEVSSPKASSSLPGPKDAGNEHENGNPNLQGRKTEAQAGVQHLLEFQGILKDRNASVRRMVGIRFAIYSQPQGGAPLWQEVQDVEVDQLGNFSARVGSNSRGGFPQYAVQSALWLGWLVQLPGEAERRMWLVDTPSGLSGEGAIARLLVLDSVPQRTVEPSGNVTEHKKN